MNADDIDLSLDCNQHIKPSYSYAQMISQAILDTEDEKLNLNGIYNYIMDKYAYYRHQLGGGWQVSRACIQDVRYITCSLLVEFYSSQSVSE